MSQNYLPDCSICDVERKCRGFYVIKDGLPFCAYIDKKSRVPTANGDKPRAKNNFGKIGRPAFVIPVSLICDTLRDTHNVQAAARQLTVSRGYLYKVLGKGRVRELVRCPKVGG